LAQLQFLPSTESWPPMMSVQLTSELSCDLQG
jgi:hypothetical protein